MKFPRRQEGHRVQVVDWLQLQTQESSVEIPVDGKRTSRADGGNRNGAPIFASDKDTQILPY